MKSMAQEETDNLNRQMQSLEQQLEVLLLPKDPLDDKNIMLEVSKAAITTGLHLLHQNSSEICTATCLHIVTICTGAKFCSLQQQQHCPE